MHISVRIVVERRSGGGRGGGGGGGGGGLRLGRGSTVGTLSTQSVVNGFREELLSEYS